MCFFYVSATDLALFLLQMSPFQRAFFFLLITCLPQGVGLNGMSAQNTQRIHLWLTCADESRKQAFSALKKVIIFILKNILLPPASKILYLTQITGGSDHKMSPVSPTRQHWHVSIKMQLFRSPSLTSVWSKTTWQLNNFPKTYCLVLVTLTLLYILSEVLILFKSKQSLALWHYQHTLRLDYLK